MFLDALSSLGAETLAQPSEPPLLPQAASSEPLHEFLVALLGQLPGQILPAPPLPGLPEPDLGPMPQGEILPPGGKQLPVALLFGEARLPRPPIPVTHLPRPIEGDIQRALPALQVPILVSDSEGHGPGRPGDTRFAGLESLLDIPQIQTPGRSPEIVTPVPRLVHLDGMNPSPSTSPVLTLSHPVGQPNWGEALGDRVLWLANQRIQSAQIRLNPPHLGPLEVRVSVVDDIASVSFGVHNLLTREALEAALPQLRDMLAQQGLQLTDANVSHRGLNSEQQGRDQSSAFGGSAAEAADASHEEVRVSRHRIGLVDDYA